MALLLDVDPVGLVRRARGSSFALAAYVNDRPYTEAYRRYVWPVDGVAGLRLAPFHLLAARPASSSTATTAGTSTAATPWSPRTLSGSSAPTAASST